MRLQRKSKRFRLRKIAIGQKRVPHFDSKIVDNFPCNRALEYLR